MAVNIRSSAYRLMRWRHLNQRLHRFGTARRTRHPEGTLTARSMARSRHAPSVRLADVVGRQPLSLAFVDARSNRSESFGAVPPPMDGNINTLFNNLATTIRNVSVAIGVFAFMWGAIQYATSGGSPHQLEQGKSAMKASLIGVGAVVLAATLVGIVFSALGGGAPGH